MMTWIKRNLYFLIGSLLALALMIVGIVMLFSQLSEENRVAREIEEKYVELKRLKTANPNPGDGTVDNVKAARDQDAALRAAMLKLHPFFDRITPIPDFTTNKISNSDFAAQLRNTVTLLHHTAVQQSVILPNDYYFTFEAQKKLMIFDAASLNRLATQLGEIKTLCEVLFDARVNSLDGIRRETVSTNDTNPPDYLTQKTVSTPLADLTPYELTFKCFSSQLATVLGSLANSPYGFIVKSINVDPSVSGSTTDEGGAGGAQGGVAPNPSPFGFRGPDGRRMSPTAPTATTPAAAKGGSVIFLNEKPLRVTLLIQLVKIKPVK